MLAMFSLLTSAKSLSVMAASWETVTALSANTGTYSSAPAFSNTSFTLASTARSASCSPFGLASSSFWYWISQ